MEGLGDMDDARAAETAGLSEATRAVLLRDNLAKQYIDDEDPINMYHGSSAKAVGHTVALKGKFIPYIILISNAYQKV